MSPQHMARAILAGWTTCYTALVAPGQRATRRAEIAADAHDHLADLAARGVGGHRAAWEILRRMIYGIPDDLIWALRPDPLEEPVNQHLPKLAMTGWTAAFIVALLNLAGAVAGLQHGWREIGQHWWSVLAIVALAATIAGLTLTLTHVRTTRRRA